MFHQKLFIHNFCHTHRLAEEKTTLLKECEDSVSLKAEETEQLRLRLEEAQQELLLANNQVWTQLLICSRNCNQTQQKSISTIYPYCTVDVAHIVMHNAIYPHI